MRAAGLVGDEASTNPRISLEPSHPRPRGRPSSSGLSLLSWWCSRPRARFARWPVARVAVVVLAAVAGACETKSSLTAEPSPSKCQVSLGGTSSVESVGGVGAITVTTQPECAWNASTPSAWISGLTPASGQGSGRIEFRAASNTSAVVREGEIVVNEDRLRVTQQAAPCAFTLTPATQAIAAAPANPGRPAL